jgi:hypothetical protein
MAPKKTSVVDPKSACACGSTVLLIDYTIGPAVTVKVCHSANRSDEPRESCLGRVLARQYHCPGCGDQVRAGQLCRTCVRRIRDALAAEAAAAEGAPVRTRAVCVAEFLPDLPNRHRPLGDRVGVIFGGDLALICGGRLKVNGAVDGTAERIPEADRVFPEGRSSSLYDVVVAEMSDEQADAFRRLLTRINDEARVAAQDGFFRGSNVLQRLADGDMSVLAFEKAQRDAGDAGDD